MLKIIGGEFQERGYSIQIDDDFDTLCVKIKDNNTYEVLFSYTFKLLNRCFSVDDLVDDAIDMYERKKI